ncbi:Tyrosine decarboxylase [Orchesella cincta]|uniref:Tyrosine decarboxylase n=1 Tax=Orchesella cincta TaxID=48709 RepID=A0A1D2MIA0_ORCCI|nr:Tyrosine decarboxylase [Orchesella cincta]
MEPPEYPENWKDIMDDTKNKIMIGMTHWQHPRFHAYFPSGASYPSILADIVGDASGPACTELEGIVLDWLAKMMNLPPNLCIQLQGAKVTSASECVLVSILAARALAIQALKRKNPDQDEGAMLSQLIAYCSKEAHSCVEKGAMIAFVKLRILETDDEFCLRGNTLQKVPDSPNYLHENSFAIEQDRAAGLYPFFVSTTVGTTSCCSADNLNEIGPICKEYDIWLHVDAAYAGGSQICEEFRYLFDGIQYAWSVNTNANKWLLTNFDCSCFWVKDRYKLTQALVVDPLYLQHSHSEESIDYRHWGIPLSRRFRALKLWFVIRIYGVEGLRKYIRNHVALAKSFENKVKQDPRFEIMNKVQLGLVCFRMKGTNQKNQKLLSTINASGKLHMVPASLNDKYVIRFCVCREEACESDMVYAWEVIKAVATEIEKSEVGSEPSSPEPEPVRRMSKETQDILKGLAERPLYIGQAYIPINEIVARASVDLTDDEVLLPRSRRGSLFPACAFIDDFSEGKERIVALVWLIWG